VTSAGAERRPSGRPTAAAAAALATRICEIAMREFLAQGYAATRIETVAAKAGVAKRTLYARWPGKPALFRSVVEQLMARWLADPDAPVDMKASLETALLELARRVLAVALQSEALALHRLLIAESGRFPELARMVRQSGAAAGVARIAALLAREAAAGRLVAPDPAFAAEQFLNLVLTGPQRRALGLGAPLDAVGLEAWARQAIRLFLDGCQPRSSSSSPVRSDPPTPTKY
jgi:TetR/AcrR family transcriptional regulator, mexJK operon transcriptional repressor